RIVRACMQLGIQKVRLTGGEPLLRKDILEIVERIAQLEGLQDLSMTTNAQMLPGKAQLLKQAGLRRLNISLDSLKPEVFHELTGGDIQPVLQGMEEAVEAGLLPLKLNIVLVRGINDAEIDDFIALTRENPIDVRFIELMPIGDHGENADRRISNQDVLAAHPYLQPMPVRYPGQPSVDYQVPGYRGRVGFISPISHQFCADCNRIRVMSDGTLRPCLGVDREISLTSALAQDDEALREAIQNAIFRKPAAHRFESCTFAERNMSRIGG
ncbi:MAG TPA: GTP 3',8-cyclase MoaA, partial [Anaerolineaceae bacterium]|nr:GTP 3',8-cyclase MoaA [Anaerolineaceae bacterium]